MRRHRNNWFEIRFPWVIEIPLIALSIGWGWFSTFLFTERVTRQIRQIEGALQTDADLSNVLQMIQPYSFHIGICASVGALMFLRSWLWQKMALD